MNDVKRAILLSLAKLPPTIFSVAILLDVILTVWLQQAAPDYKIISGALGLMLLSLVGVIWVTVIKKIDQNEATASERATKIEQSTSDRADKIEAEMMLQVASLQREAKESAIGITAQLTADRGIRDQYHQNNLLALCHIMQAMKTGDMSKLEPELLFSQRLHLKQGGD